MIRICPTCGYRTDHLKHYQNCSIPKSDWPAQFNPIRLPFPAVSVKVADANGIHEVPVTMAVSGGASTGGLSPFAPVEAAGSIPPEAALLHAGDVLTAVIETESRERARLSEADRIRLAPGACCAHPHELHIADAEGFPPTCMGCPEGRDEHEWVASVLTYADVAVASPMQRTINSPLNLVCPDCSFLARTAAGLKTHRTRKHAEVNVG